MPRWIDLHMHSTASDGAYSPTRLMELAAARGLSAVALTDHDTTAGLAEASAAAERLGMQFVPGVELAAHRARGVLHLLGYFVDSAHPTLRAHMEKARARRRDRTSAILARLERLGIPVPMEELAPGPAESITRAHLAKALVRRGMARDLRDAFGRYLAEGRPAFVAPELPSAGEAISAIRTAGGIASLAHPSQLACESDLELETMIRRLAAAGLRAVEVLHPDHSPRLRSIMEGLARRFGLLRTGGSDFHALPPTVRRGVGFCGLRVPHDWLVAMADALK